MSPTAQSRSAARIRSFDDLPIPFRAVATDLETGEKVTYQNGGGSDIGGLTTGTDYYVIKGEKVIKTVRREPPRRAKSPRVSASKVRPVRLSPTEVKATPTDDPSDDLDLPAEFADDLEVEPLE